jgi:hypothetical protein
MERLIMNLNQFDPFSVSAYILSFIIIWVGVSKLLSVVGGWNMLSRDYRANSIFDGKKMWLKSIGMRRWTNYNNCITVGANKYGLYLAVLPIFRVGHAPLFIPWAEISTEAGSRRLFGNFVKFRFAKQPDVPVIFSEKCAARIFKIRQDSQNGYSV